MKIKNVFFIFLYFVLICLPAQAQMAKRLASEATPSSQAIGTGKVPRERFLKVLKQLPGMSQPELYAAIGRPAMLRKSDLPDSESLYYYVEPRFKCDLKAGGAQPESANLIIKTQHGQVRFFQILLDTTARVKSATDLISLKVAQAEKESPVEKNIRAATNMISKPLERGNQTSPYAEGDSYEERWARFARLIATSDKSDVPKVEKLLGKGRTATRVAYQGKTAFHQYYLLLFDLKETDRIQTAELTYNEQEKLVEIIFTDDPQGAKHVH
ncbi:hypothetical protein KBI23_25430 [bacterium]|nr:hypothetical protein [bacterium]MBP9811586.1 hypothetical protein [bacterium]